MNYQEFMTAFEASGLTQKAYGNQIGKSASMVHYYLRRARQEQDQSADTPSSFQELKLDRTTSQQITITTSAGLQIVIPV